MSDFNFIVDETGKEEPLVPEIVDDSESKIAKMSPRKVGQIILEAFDQIGGVKWLVGQAHIDPRGFIELLKKVLPKTIQAEGFDGLTVVLRDQYGNQMEVSTLRNNDLGRASPVPAIGGEVVPLRPGQPQIATGGNPNLDIVVKETYE
jgi:hypothetical protein